MLTSHLKKIENQILSLCPLHLRYYLRYLRVHKGIVDFNHPVKFSEKIYHRMRFPKKEFSDLSDKYLVRDYVTRKIGEKYLVPLYECLDKLDQDVINRLPDSFVIKATHGAGYVKIVKDKNKESHSTLIREVNSWLNKDFSTVVDELHYKDIQPKIIVEKALLINDTPPADYKIHVFRETPNAKPFIFFQVIGGRFEELQQNFFMEDWSPAPFIRKGSQSIKNSNLLIKPKCLEEMIDIADKLSKPFGYCRVDLYIFEDSPFFGELTFTPSSGNYVFKPKKWDTILGHKFGW
ncbi:ATP-grasp fold amidoligase family protein [Cobetia sp. LC6]|uniref:ATP-grasp fold amidoligase family protein n=1 Tax=Cobetia sp. LC6 TaxID=3050947 RepID=UPI00255673A4|nr:ATP-grasp fold amidoligase family protein [Cobetia sp. LC6]MDL2192667.1 ATP-grasp fold amidoligase family protein [Cobetia sp. LC6]